MPLVELAEGRILVRRGMVRAPIRFDLSQIESVDLSRAGVAKVKLNDAKIAEIAVFSLDRTDGQRLLGLLRDSAPKAVAAAI